MKIEFSKLFSKPATLLVLWLFYLFSPLLKVLRYYFIVNFAKGPQLVRFVLSSVSTILAWLPLFLSVVTLIVWGRRYIFKKLPSSVSLTLMAVILLSLIFIFVSRSLINLEVKNYVNFLYSKTGISRDDLELMEGNIYLFVLGVSTVLLVNFAWTKKFWTWIKRPLSRQSLKDIGRIEVTIAVFGFLALFSQAAYPIWNWKGLEGKTYGGYEAKVGAHFRYLTAIKEATDEDSVIIHPPQNKIWPAIGNQPVIRYFLFPRTLVSGTLVKDVGFLKDFEELYFVEVDPTSPESMWPTLNTNVGRISFNQGDFVEYSQLTLVSEKEGVKVYKVTF